MSDPQSQALRQLSRLEPLLRVDDPKLADLEVLTGAIGLHTALVESDEHRILDELSARATEAFGSSRFQAAAEELLDAYRMHLQTEDPIAHEGDVERPRVVSDEDEEDYEEMNDEDFDAIRAAANEESDDEPDE